MHDVGTGLPVLDTAHCGAVIGTIFIHWFCTVASTSTVLVSIRQPKERRVILLRIVAGLAMLADE